MECTGSHVTRVTGDRQSHDMGDWGAGAWGGGTKPFLGQWEGRGFPRVYSVLLSIIEGFTLIYCSDTHVHVFVENIDILEYKIIETRSNGNWTFHFWVDGLSRKHVFINYINEVNHNIFHLRGYCWVMRKCSLKFLSFLGVLSTREKFATRSSLPPTSAEKKVCLQLVVMDEFLTGNCNSDQMQTDLVPKSSQFIKITIDLFGAFSSLQTVLHFNTFWELII